MTATDTGDSRDDRDSHPINHAAETTRFPDSTTPAAQEPVPVTREATAVLYQGDSVHPDPARPVLGLRRATRSIVIAALQPLCWWSWRHMS